MDSGPKKKREGVQFVVLQQSSAGKKVGVTKCSLYNSVASFCSLRGCGAVEHNLKREGSVGSHSEFQSRKEGKKGFRLLSRAQLRRRRRTNSSSSSGFQAVENYLATVDVFDGLLAEKEIHIVTIFDGSNEIGT